MKTRNTFKDLDIGDRFRGPVSKGIGQQADTLRYVVYVKTSPSTAKIVDKIGFGNKRGVGEAERFAPGKMTWAI